jgi:glycosyltransferase involved in cell wall biosynthesis
MFVLFLTRHYNQKYRVSGVISYLKELDQGLRNKGIKTNILYTPSRHYEKINSEKHVVPVSINPISIIKQIKRLKPTQIVLMSSTSDPLLLYCWWLSIVIAIPSIPCYFYQATNLRRPPLNIQMYFLRHTIRTIIAGNSTIYNTFSKFIDTVLLPPAISLKPNLTTEPGYSSEKLTILFMGHYSKTKGADIFIKLSQFSSLKECDFLIAGEIAKRGSTLFNHARKVANYQKNLHVFGYLNSPEDLISRSDILLLPYRTGDSVLAISQTAIEALSLGKPVITTPNTATKDLIIDGFNGYICQSIDTMEKKLLSLKNDFSLYKTLSNNAIATVKQNFNIEERIQEFIKVLNDEI